MLKSKHFKEIIRSPYTVVFILLFILVRVILVHHLDYNYGGGDAKAYEQAARDTSSSYFSVTPDYLEKIRHYQFNDKDGTFPYHDINSHTFWEPGYILFLKLIYQIHDSRDLVIISQYLLVLLLVLIWIKILKTSFPIRGSLVVGALLLFHPFSLAQPTLLYTEIVDSVLIGAFIYFALTAKGYNNIYLGLTAGVLLITESFYLPFICLVYAYLLLKQRSLKLILLQSIPLILIISPVVYHNYIYTDGAITLATKNSYNLWTDNNIFEPENYDQGENGSPGSKFLKDNSLHPNARQPCKVLFKDQQSCELKNFITFVTSSPSLFISRSLVKWQNFWSPNLFGFGFGFNKYALKLDDKWSARVNNFYVLLEVLFQLVFLICFCLCFFQKSVLISFIKGHFLFVHLVIAIGHGMIRYRFPMVPSMIAIIYIATTDRTYLEILKRTPYRILILFVVLLLFFISTWWKKLPLAWISL